MGEPHAAGQFAGAAQRHAIRIRVEGLVQGVGFRPYVHALAVRLALCGHVVNDVGGVTIEVEGAPSAVAAFRRRLAREAPPLARVERMKATPIAPSVRAGFVIRESLLAGARRALVSPDIATCDDCLRELFDPADRRFRHPFITCTNCGPRFTIVEEVPYDRRRTTMADFPMCAACAREYVDPGDRRFHAQPIACPRCGPALRLIDVRGIAASGDPITEAADLLRDGRIVAVKGIGGYHLACDATAVAAVAGLRRRKVREEKPFALMVRDLAAARVLAAIDEVEEEALASPSRPIVLVHRRDDDGRPGPAALAPGVAPRNRAVGLMLPYTPIHHLLCAAFDRPLVFTSGNVSDEPIAYDDLDARRRLGRIADAFLVHDRPIATRADDSVVRVVRGRAQPVRRARGFAPRPIPLPVRADRPILACGAELKSTFCVAHGRDAFVSQHLGDLENYETLCAFTRGVAHYERLFRIHPEIVAHDLHPEYLATKYALERPDVRLVGVQHHHAHVAACLADNGETRPVIGVAFDGLGWGGDGTLWGGEFLVADLAGFERAAHFEPVPLPGGAAAIREPWRMAAVYLAAAGCDPECTALGVRQRNAARWPHVLRLAHSRLAPLTSSVGRLFDAVAALLDVRDVATYEGQAAIELEQGADCAERGAYRATISETSPLRVRGADLVRAVLDDALAGLTTARIAARFHNGLAGAVAEVCGRLRAAGAPATVALTGGVFQNALLVARATRELEASGFRVLTHARVPPNDGGISFGQAAVAAARRGT